MNPNRCVGFLSPEKLILPQEDTMKTVYLGIDFHATKIVTHRIERLADGELSRANGSYYTEEIPAFIKTLDRDTYVCVEA